MVRDLPHAVQLFSAFRTADLEASIAKAESFGLQLVRQYGTKGAVREAEFDPCGSYGMTVKLTERPGVNG